MSLRISDMDPGQRPRERMRERGAGSLSEAELLAILLRTGRPGRSAVDEAQNLLTEAGGLTGIARMSVRELEKRPGIGAAKASALLAALELGRRVAREDLKRGRILDRPEAAGEFLVALLKGRRREVFGFLSLDAKHGLLQVRELWVGTRNHAPVDPAEVFRSALLDDAASVIVFHNHPSGELRPSTDDLDLTERLVGAGRLLGVEVSDHLIVAGPDWVSLRTHCPQLFAHKT